MYNYVYIYIYILIYTYTAFQHFIRFLCSFRSTAALRKLGPKQKVEMVTHIQANSQQFSNPGLVKNLCKEPPQQKQLSKIYQDLGAAKTLEVQSSGSNEGEVCSLKLHTNEYYVDSHKKKTMTGFRFRQAPISKNKQKLKFQPQNDWKSHTLKWRLPCYASCLQVSRRRFPWKYVCFPTIFVHLLTAFEMTKVSNSEFSGIMPSL